MSRPVRCLGVFLIAVGLPLHFGARAQAPQPLTVAQRQAMESGLRQLRASLESQRGRSPAELADAAIYAKGVEWALRYDREFSAGDVALLERAIERGFERLRAMDDGEWRSGERKGKMALGYVSSVDGSVQPYGVIVPRGHDASAPLRLDVVLHGSTRPVGMSELRFMARFEDSGGDAAPDQPFIELHPLGRVENCYRWAGETDVFEAIEDVCRRYAVDRRRIVLRGMSMGASGTWHLGLKHPDRFVALGPYCGYVDTHRFSETPLPNFVRVGALPEHQELALHMLDSIDYAANAGMVPAVACMGEKDVFFQAHVLMGEAMQREGLTMVNLISPGTGHVIDPVTHAEQMRLIGEHVARGLDPRPNEIRFVTWTLKYSRCHWLQLLGLERHYARAEVSAGWDGERVEITDVQNVTRLAVRGLPLRSLRIGGETFSIPASQAEAIVVARHGDGWRVEQAEDDAVRVRKLPGLQGPIDDAFTSPFLCVRGTGRPWNAAVHAYAEFALRRFAQEWHQYFRGEPPIKADTEVTEEDVRTRNLILFGDPGSNRWIADVLPHLPLTWTQESVQMGGHSYAAADHLPALVHPNPLARDARRYVVLNSGHTFHEAELAAVNYLLFPRWGDWAVLRLVDGPFNRAASLPKETVVAAGYFDEQWRLR